MYNGCHLSMAYQKYIRDAFVVLCITSRNVHMYSIMMASLVASQHLRPQYKDSVSCGGDIRSL